jgi:hypothetical protein
LSHRYRTVASTSATVSDDGRPDLLIRYPLARRRASALHLAGPGTQPSLCGPLRSSARSRSTCGDLRRVYRFGTSPGELRDVPT